MKLINLYLVSILLLSSFANIPKIEGDPAFNDLPEVEVKFGSHSLNLPEKWSVEKGEDPRIVTVKKDCGGVVPCPYLVYQKESLESGNFESDEAYATYWIQSLREVDMDVRINEVDFLAPGKMRFEYVVVLPPNEQNISGLIGVVFASLNASTVETWTFTGPNDYAERIEYISEANDIMFGTNLF